MLSHKEIAAMKPAAKPYKRFDGGGLYVEVATTGSKGFRLKFRFNRKEKRLGLGTFPETSLKDAREKRDEARRLLAK